MNVFHWRGPAVQLEKPVKRGRPQTVFGEEERKQRHREAALRHYHKRKRREVQ